MRLGMIIKDYRNEHNISMDEFARRTGLSKAYIGMLEKGVHPKVVAERLGHSSIRITLDTYSHVIKGMQSVAVSKLDEIEDGW